MPNPEAVSSVSHPTNEHTWDWKNDRGVVNAVAISLELFLIALAIGTAKQNQERDTARMAQANALRGQQTQEIPSNFILYTVQPGDTLLGIASLHGAEVEELVAINNLNDANLIFAGQELFVPRS